MIENDTPQCPESQQQQWHDDSSTCSSSSSSSSSDDNYIDFRYDDMIPRQQTRKEQQQQQLHEQEQRRNSNYDEDEYILLITVEFNNIAAELFENGEYDDSMSLYQEAIRIISLSSSSSSSSSSSFHDNSTHSNQKASSSQQAQDHFWDADDKRNIIEKITRGKKRLYEINHLNDDVNTNNPKRQSQHNSNSLGSNKNNPHFFGDDLDMYHESGSACDQVPKFLSQPLRIMDIPATSTPQQHNIYHATLLYNTSLIHLHSRSFDSSRSTLLQAYSLLSSTPPTPSDSHPPSCQVSSTPLLPSLLNNLGSLNFRRGRLDDAESHYLSSIRHNRSHVTPSWYLLSVTLSNIGMIYYCRGQFEESLNRCRDAWDARRMALGRGNLEVVVVMYNLGLICQRMGLLEDALTSFKVFLNRVVELMRRRRGMMGEEWSRHVVTVSIRILFILCQWVTFDNESFDIDQSLKQLQSRRLSYGYSHPKVSAALSHVGNLLFKRCEYQYALHFFTEQLRIDRSHLGEFHPELAVTLNRIGQTYHKQLLLDDAMASYEEALTLQPYVTSRKTVSNKSIFAVILYNMGMIVLNTMPERALDLFESSVVLRKRLIGENHQHIATMLYNIGLAQLEIGRIGNARHSFLESLRIRRFVYGNNHRRVGETLFQLGRIHDERGEFEEAIHVYNESLRVEEIALGKYHPDVAATLCKIGGIYHVMGRLGEAIRVYKDVLAIVAQQHLEEETEQGEEEEEEEEDLLDIEDDDEDEEDVTTDDNHDMLIPLDRRRRRRAAAAAAATNTTSTTSLTTPPSQPSPSPPNQQFGAFILSTLANVYAQIGDMEEATRVFSEANRLLSAESMVVLDDDGGGLRLRMGAAAGGISSRLEFVYGNIVLVSPPAAAAA